MHEFDGAGLSEYIFRARRLAGAERTIQALIKISNRHLKSACAIQQPARGDAIDPPLVLLHLLEREAKKIGQPLLAHADFQSASPYALTQFLINIPRCSLVAHVHFPKTFQAHHAGGGTRPQPLASTGARFAPCAYAPGPTFGWSQKRSYKLTPSSASLEMRIGRKPK